MKGRFHFMANMKETRRNLADTAAPSGSGEPGVAGRIAAAYHDLTAGERRLADEVLAAAGELAGLTAAELADRAGVSAATAVRFFRRLGFPNYAAVRRAARHPGGWSAAWGSPLAELADARRGRGDEDFAAAAARDMQNLAETAAALAPAAIAAAVALVGEARRVWIIGFRNSAALAAYAAGLLTHVRADIRLLPRPGQTLAEDLVDLSPGDALVVLGFRRRLTTLGAILATARAAGVRTLLVADMTAAGDAEHADVTLCCVTRGAGIFDSYAAPVALLNHLAVCVGRARGAEAEARLAAIEDLHARLDPLLPPGRSPPRRG
jgi:DNA-binding MurR/RpiR family transcriptional regulator